ncbi:hypothetical protein Tco_1090573 [Tanacetum coccineum]|uniref:RNA-directed DNA polymerase, eukaryota, reverse transcriptase zinc-binding domain protein n=1 Tax=Tanacetum coccineum TaxID=301880 RepID=A0ABQ5I5X0_9ASTR
MEVFSLILQREINREPLFQYHFGCKNLKVSHVCFADDLLVMCHGDATSEISVDKEDSWGWKNLLEIRDQIKDYVVYKIGDGNSTSLWFDNWSEIGPLFHYITYKDLYDEILTSCLKVSDMIREGEWKWPSEWHHKFPMITCLDVPAINTNIEDKIV